MCVVQSRLRTHIGTECNAKLTLRDAAVLRLCCCYADLHHGLHITLIRLAYGRRHVRCSSVDAGPLTAYPVQRRPAGKSTQRNAIKRDETPASGRRDNHLHLPPLFTNLSRRLHVKCMSLFGTITMTLKWTISYIHWKYIYTMKVRVSELFPSS